MKRFLHGHATHPQPLLAFALAAAQVDAQRQRGGSVPTLGWLYFTDHCAAAAEALVAEARARWPGVAWTGAMGVGVAASGVEYVDEPAVVLMLAELPRSRFRVFSGVRPLGDFEAATALVHADPQTPELDELVGELADRTAGAALFGGLASGLRARPVTIADEVLHGGLSGVAFGPDVVLATRVTQGCQPAGPTRRITRSERNVVLALDGEPALDCLLRDLALDADPPRTALARLHQTLVGLSDAAEPAPRRGAFGSETRVRHLLGIDPGRRGIAIAEQVPADAQLAFCQRGTEAARRDLVRICAELREEFEPESLSLDAALALRDNAAEPSTAANGGMAGAVYVSCAGRGGAHFGAPSAELAIVRRALGDVPLAGFFAAGEIAGRHTVGYTGVLTVFR